MLHEENCMMKCLNEALPPTYMSQASKAPVPNWALNARHGCLFAAQAACPQHNNTKSKQARPDVHVIQAHSLLE